MATKEYHFSTIDDAFTCANALHAAAGVGDRLRIEETQHYAAVFVYPDADLRKLAEERQQAADEQERQRQRDFLREFQRIIAQWDAEFESNDDVWDAE